MSKFEELADLAEKACPGADREDYLAAVLISMELLGLVDEATYATLMRSEFNLALVEQMVESVASEHFDVLAEHVVQD